MRMATNPLFATKNLRDILAEAEGHGRLKRVLGPVGLTALGIGAIIGAGIFVATGAAARETAGPALMLSYMVAGMTCIFAALCYAEFASMAPVAGSAYTYAYCTLGELFAWIIGWDLVLEYAVGSATVANGWSSYFQAVMKKAGWELPSVLQSAPVKFDHSAPWNDPTSWFALTGAYINLPAVIIVVIVTAVLVKGIQESAGFNALMVFVKTFAVVFVIIMGAFFVNPANWTDNFAPFGYGGFSFFGIPQLTIGQTVEGRPVGMLAGAAIIFFAYIGFDAVSTQAEEAKNPGRDVPIGIIASLVVCTLLYIGVVAVLTGMVPYSEIDKGAGVSSAFKTAAEAEGTSPLVRRILGTSEVIINIAGVAGITSVLLVLMLSGPRVLLAMARDGLIPTTFFADVHPVFQTPWKSTLAVGTFVTILAGVLPIDALLELTNIGTLFAFAVVCAAVLVMRRTNPEAHRPFKCPLVPVVPTLGILLCLMLMMSLPVGNWLRLIVWLLLGLGIYFIYGQYHSVLGKQLRGELPMPGSARTTGGSDGIKAPDTGYQRGPSDRKE
jgi:APA family basic amino acid/polyamine antiporter